MKDVYRRILESIPDYKTFLTIDEMNASSKALADRYPDVVELTELGRSREGEPLLCLKIGNGSHPALMFGCPHPNEPIGTMMLEYFTEQLAADQELRESLDYTWYIVKVWDIDGFRMNEPWLKGPYTLYNYSRNFFRPAGHKQVDWTFPVDYKKLHFHEPLPETQAMMKLIDDVKPEFIYALHNAGFGGVYWYLTEPAPETYEAMYKAAETQKIPVNLGEPEAPYLAAFAPAIYASMGIEQDYDYLEQYTDADMSQAIRAGTCGADYARKKWNSFTLLTELPYFYDRRIDDGTASDVLRRDAVVEKCDWSVKTNQVIRDILALSRDYLDPENPFLLALDAFGDDEIILAEKKMAETDPAYDKAATVAEEFDNRLISKFYKLLSYGMLVRANEYELKRLGPEQAETEGAKALRRAFTEAEKVHRQLAEQLEEDIDYEVIPIRKLISIQLECGLIIAEYLKEQHRQEEPLS